MVVKVTGIAVGISLASARDTFMSQSFGGKNLKCVGDHMQRGVLILMLCCFPCWADFVNTEHILLLLKQDPEVSRYEKRGFTERKCLNRQHKQKK
ncbi:PREDICTED: multidrug and toxin extrusion protein 2-like [Rhinopithecus bieti]|uniref:multidrug and toxin extrusion protein 2-like n=1 Tax=Rhinopithecus bieti TaxID=61621 RepID=UPI00083C2DB5|nr:PREDICTED: multidrug and toxin extrusion protein 2-like [Rhinopithecus bieti]